jgi:hypothetical protein
VGPGDTTVVVTDANQLSWAAAIFRVWKTPDGLGELPLGLRELVVREAKEFGLTNDEAQHAMLVPVRFDGGRWSKTVQGSSSTMRERLAILEALQRNREILSEPLVIVSDNQNVRKQWHGIKGLPQKLIPVWEEMQSYSINYVHIPRVSTVMQWIDAVARNIEGGEGVDIDEDMDTPSV